MQVKWGTLLEGPAGFFQIRFPFLLPTLNSRPGWEVRWGWRRCPDILHLILFTGTFLMTITEMQETILLLLEPGRRGLGPGAVGPEGDLLSLQWMHALGKELPNACQHWAWGPAQELWTWVSPLSFQSLFPWLQNGSGKANIKHGWGWKLGAWTCLSKGAWQECVKWRGGQRYCFKYTM